MYACPGLPKVVQPPEQRPEERARAAEVLRRFDAWGIDALAWLATVARRTATRHRVRARRRSELPTPDEDLMAVADEVLKLHAICMNCGAPATHTYRSIDGRPAHADDPIILIGATEAYEARCRACFKLRGKVK